MSTLVFQALALLLMRLHWFLGRSLIYRDLLRLGYIVRVDNCFLLCLLVSNTIIKDVVNAI